MLDQVHADQLDRGTPCADWTVAALVDHLVAAPGRFVTMMRGEEPDWSADPARRGELGPDVPRRPATTSCTPGTSTRDRPRSPADWQTAELAVHTWDLATAIGYPVDRLDPEVAERGLAFMRANLTADDRGPVFGPEAPSAEGAGPYERLAAFAGRAV